VIVVKLMTYKVTDYFSCFILDSIYLTSS